jgi:hypothetical protein
MFIVALRVGEGDVKRIRYILVLLGHKYRDWILQVDARLTTLLCKRKRTISAKTKKVESRRSDSTYIFWKTQTSQKLLRKAVTQKGLAYLY